jgi:hypothetical protein
MDKLPTRQEALATGAKRYRGAVCPKHPALAGERVITTTKSGRGGLCLGCRREGAVKRAVRKRTKMRKAWAEMKAALGGRNPTPRDLQTVTPAGKRKRHTNNTNVRSNAGVREGKKHGPKQHTRLGAAE